MYTEQLKNGRYRHQLAFVEERTGKKKKVSVTTDKNTQKARREAEAALNEKIRAINAAFVPDDETLREALDAYLMANKSRWRPGTHRRNTYAANALCRLLDPDTKLQKLSARFVIDRFSASDRSGTTLNELIARLKAFLSWCWKTQRLDDISWKERLEPFPEPTAKEKNKMKYLEREELTKLLDGLNLPLRRMMVSFMALSGLRVGECIALRKEDVDLSDRLIHVRNTIDHRSGEVLEGAKTAGSVRDVYIQDELLTLCRDIRKYMTEMAMKCGFRTEFFFSDFEGRPVNYYTLEKYFRENTERIIGRPLTLHSLRHTHASLMFEGGATLEAVSLRLGHSDSRTTKDIYVHVTERLKSRYNETFDRIKILS